ncbi:AAA family ATPase [Mesorhizobium sp. M0621]|uniref:trifunctional serine/threonine-protein kinase/ATP-binding protein/sensor histidine kinase n=1 Tax=unclassified Mesorhizobium TaxID=325217 RepID=UPI003335D6C7
MTQSFRIVGEEHVRFVCGDVEVARHCDATGTASVLIVSAAAERMASALSRHFAHEFALRDELDPAWAVRPLALDHAHGSTALVLEDLGGDFLARLIDGPMETGRFLTLAVGAARALGGVHHHGLIHKDVKPAKIVVTAEGEVRLTGFGIASRLGRERQAPSPPETIDGTLAYMAPEQTGRMNRSIDTRSDLYSLGVTFYQMVTGELPFVAPDPMELVHCHIARRPVVPHMRVATIPSMVSAIITKLLAKTPEDRYQTALGLERDLLRCLADWTATGRVKSFSLGVHDIPNRLLIPEKLYGRERESEVVISSFERVVRTGHPVLLLVAGYSGTGKSAVVHELHKALVPPRAFFSSGKFDQNQRDSPYGTLVQAFRQLVRPLLGKSDEELACWRQAFLDVLGPNGRLMTDLIPELKLIIGEQPQAPELSLQQAQARFQLVFQRFIGVFAQPEHPLALFLDDLQWLDMETLDLIEDILTRSQLKHLLLIGAYRDNEVSASHPLMQKLAAIKAGGGRVTELALAPLGRPQLTEMISDTLHSPQHDCAPLAELVHEKTDGNPFFVIQFLSMLAENSLLAFDHERSRWVWDVTRIKAQGYTENIVDLMVEKLGRLPKDTQAALQELSCIGNGADMATLSLLLGADAERIDAILWPARRLDLIQRTATGYRFTHDRVQEAAYLLLPEAERAAAHLRIGRLMAGAAPVEGREEAIFDIVNQLNRGAGLITADAERQRVVELNLVAGKRTTAAAAYASAHAYFETGVGLLTVDDWTVRPDLAFELTLHLAECEFVTGNPSLAEERLVALLPRATGLSDLAALTRLRGEIFVTLNQQSAAVEVALDYLRHVGIDWSAHPTKAEVETEYRRLRDALGDRPIDSLRHLPPMTDPVARPTMEVLLQMASPSVPTDANLLCLVACRMANLTLEYGRSDISAAAYVWSGMVLGPYLGDYKAGFEVASLGLDLVERSGLARFRGRANMLFGAHVSPWTRPMRDGRVLLRRAFEQANDVGDVIFAGFSCANLLSNLLASGHDLEAAQREAEDGLRFARDHQFSYVVDLMTPQLQLIRALRGALPALGRFEADVFSEDAFERRTRSLPIANCWYWIRKLQLGVFAREHASAIEGAAKAEPLLWTSASSLEIVEYHFYAALARAGLCDDAGQEDRAVHVAAVASHHGRLLEWSDHERANFEDRATLVGAEIARIEGRVVDAMRLYDRAIDLAQSHGIVHHQALANELAARFYASQGFETIARTYLREALQHYGRWGAAGKVRQLETTAPYSHGDGDPAERPTSTGASSVESLDLATVIRVSQAVAGETDLDRLIDTLMRTAMEHAGGEKAVLLLVDGPEHRVEAQASVDADGVIARSRDKTDLVVPLPDSILRYVARVRESVILDDASKPNTFSNDIYLAEGSVRSLLCLPLVNQNRLIGLLYLENNLAPRVFTSRKVAVLKLLSVQAAISLENARLYRDIEERESKIRRLVESDIIGILIWDLDGRLIEANDAFLTMLQYTREDLRTGLRWFDMTPPEWQEEHIRVEAEELRTTGAMRAREKEFFRKDGSRVPVLIGAAAFETQPDQGVAYILDLTDLKRAEAEARENERRYQEAQMELVHANRASTLGQLAASIAHEVNQPIAAIVTNAQVSLREIRGGAPDLAEVTRVFDKIVKDGLRAGAVVGRIRNLIRKSPPIEDALQINAPVREVIELTRDELNRHSITVVTRFAEDLPNVIGDRVQIQQVMLNLIINAVEAMSSDDATSRELLVSTGLTAASDVQVTVADTGPGLAPDIDGREFDAFATTKAAGLGMGLSICRSIIEAHGGRISASCNMPRGAVFVFTLPAVSDAELREASPAPAR